MSTQFLNYLKHNKDSITPLTSDVLNYTLESVVFMDGTQLKDITLEDLYNVVWANLSKSASQSFTNTSKSASPTFTNQSKN